MRHLCEVLGRDVHSLISQVQYRSEGRRGGGGGLLKTEATLRNLIVIPV
jgi:hypothetical protein